MPRPSSGSWSAEPSPSPLATLTRPQLLSSWPSTKPVTAFPRYIHSGRASTGQDPGNTGWTDRSDAHTGGAESLRREASMRSVGAVPATWGRCNASFPCKPGLKEESKEAARQTVERVMPGGGPALVGALSVRECAEGLKTVHSWSSAEKGGCGRRPRSCRPQRSRARALQRSPQDSRRESAFPFPDLLPPSPEPRAGLPGELGSRIAALDPKISFHGRRVGPNHSERPLLSSQKPPVQPFQLQLPPGLAWQMVEEAAGREREPPVPKAILPQGDPHPGCGHPGLYL